MAFRRLALILVLPLALGACSSLKFWEKSSTESMAELKPIVNPIALDFAWRARVGKAEDRLLQAVLLGDSVVAAGTDGEISRIENGKILWRIDAKCRLVNDADEDRTSRIKHAKLLQFLDLL